MDVVVQAANLLRDQKDILFRIVGREPERLRGDRLVSRLALKNVEMIDWLPYHELPHQIERSSICLGGHFSTYEKANRVIASKTYQYLAMRKATIVGRAKANTELLKDGRDAIMCERGSPESLANCILSLKEDRDLTRRIADNGYRRFREQATPEIIGKQLGTILGGMLN